MFAPLQVPPPLDPDDAPPALPGFRVLDAFALGPRLIFRRPGPVLATVFLVFLGTGIGIAVSFVPGAVWVTLPLLLAVAGPVVGSVSYLALKAWRGEAVRVRDLPREGFSRFGPLAATFAILLIFTLLALVPGVATIAVGIQTGDAAQDLTPAAAALLVGGFFGGLVLALTPAAFYGFAPTLVLEHGISVREALRLSRRTTWKQPVRSLVFAATCAVLLAAGLLLAGLGLLITLPWVLGARAQVHDACFGSRHATAG